MRFQHPSYFGRLNPAASAADARPAAPEPAAGHQPRESIVYRRFERLTGLSFPQVRQTAYVNRWLEVLQECGARYIETDSSLRLDPATIHVAYINHLVSTANAGLVVTRA